MLIDPLLARYAILPPDLLRCASYTSHGGLAWARADALAMLRVIEARGYGIFSVEPWLPTRPGPTPLIEDCDRDGNRGMSAETSIATSRWTLTEPEDTALEVIFAIDVERLH